jgi:hypothetical protein
MPGEGTAEALRRKAFGGAVSLPQICQETAFT